MPISKTNLPLEQITKTKLPGLNGAPAKVGFSIGGFWLNGSDEYATEQELQDALIGKELTHSKSGKSLVVVGAFVKDVEFIKSILTVRETMEYTDLSDLL